MINENKLARDISRCEGKKVPVNIAQIKEVLRITLDRLALDYSTDDVAELLMSRYIPCKSSAKRVRKKLKIKRKK